MLILFDARSVRTPAGRGVLMGLTGGWLKDRRVSSVAIAVPSWLSPERGVPTGVQVVPLRARSWPAHLMVDLPRLARALRADVVFAPNALAPRHDRAVAYFQDLHHFRGSEAGAASVRSWLRRATRRVWWSYAMPTCKLAVAVSRDIAIEVQRNFRVPVTRIPNGVETGGERWRGEAPRVFVMGGTGERKREDLALLAWARVSERLRRSITLVVGGVEPAARRATLADLARRLDIEKEVTLLGALSRTRYLAEIAASRLAVSCSSLEAFGLPVAEAFALGAPVVCTALPAHQELQATANAGWVFPRSDHVALADVLERALGGDLPPRVTAPPAGWSWDARAREHVDHYERMLAAA